MEYKDKMPQGNDNDALKKIGQAFKGKVSILEDVIQIVENQPKRDDLALVNQVGGYLCGTAPCTYHIAEAQKLINMVKKHYNITG